MLVQGCLINVGDKIPYKHGTLRVMAIAEGVLMVRYPRCGAFCLYVSDLKKEGYLKEFKV